ncbi:MAG TPA: TonB-dependent receptor [Methylomusa anaerophila]|uniref:Ferric enterobactin receptor n=1 Tax=Methylomusa anaerophila TaxID=1930071 RepID=A0A348AF06_9FIRM|nr:TonB-dependent receptor [Methylomusa anaerophila]BBB89654.1 ferric enterobactin receptor precursor [Methylomusa anaerophila]HML89570.1 TonB-dependent receptor [Methylomusa anaerophila]
MNKASLGLTLIALLNFAPAVYAEDSAPEDFTLETIVVTDSRIVGEGETTKVTSLNVKDKIDAGQINSVTDLLQDVPGIVVTKDPQSGTSVAIRGMTNERLLVAINGNVIENQGGLYRGRALEWDSLPVSNVKKIEIIRGASSAIYGGTWGGIINIVTVDKPGENKSFLKYSYGSYHNEKYSFTNQGTTDDGKFSWTINANRREDDGYYRNNFLNSDDINLNMTYNFSEKKKVSFALTDSYRKEGILVGNNRSVNNENGWDPGYPEVPVAPTSTAKSGSQYLDGSYREFNTKNYSLNYYDHDWKLSVYQNKQTRNDWLRYTGSVDTPEIKTDNSGYSWQKNRRIGNHSLTTGLDYRNLRFDVASSSSNNSLAAELNGYFLQDNWQVNKKTLVGLGLRYDQYQSEDRRSGKEFTDASQLSPKVNITYQVNPREAVYASASRVFRAPTVSDYVRWQMNYDPSNVANSNYTKYKTYNGLSWTLADWQNIIGQLEPETGMAYELGWKKQFPPNFGVKITGFLNDIDNYVTTYMGSGINSGPPTYNIGNAKVKGVELATDYQFSQTLGLVFNYTHQHASKTGDRLDITGSELTTIPQETINLGFRYNNQKGFQASLDGQRIQTVASAETKGYMLFNLGLAYTRNDKTVALAINNLFDVDYQQTKDFPMPGINYSISYQTSF